MGRFFPGIDEYKDVVCAYTQNNKHREYVEDSYVPEIKYHSENKPKSTYYKINEKVINTIMLSANTCLHVCDVIIVTS